MIKDFVSVESVNRKKKKKNSDREYKVCYNFEKLFCNPKFGRLFKMHDPLKRSGQSFEEKPKPEDDQEKAQVSHSSAFQRDRTSKKKAPSYTTVFFYLSTDENEKDVTDAKTPKKVSFDKEQSNHRMEKVSKKEMVIELPIKSAKMVTKAVQTDYRESETQTLPWMHEIKAKRKLLEELLLLKPFFLESNFLPGLREVTLIEMARQKLAWENVLSRLRGRKNEVRRKLLAGKIAEAETAAREKTATEINEKRMDLSKKLMNKEKERWEDQLMNRLQKLYRTRRKENDMRIHRWNHQLLRKIRKMKRERIQTAISSKTDTEKSNRSKFFESYGFARDREIPDLQRKYLKKIQGLNQLEKHIYGFTNRRTSAFDYGEASKPKKFGLCFRRLKLEEWRSKTKEKSDDEDNVSSIRVPVPESGLPTPRTDRPESDAEEELNQASIFLVKIVKGRAIQTKKIQEFHKVFATQSS